MCNATRQWWNVLIFTEILEWLGVVYIIYSLLKKVIHNLKTENDIRPIFYTTQNHFKQYI